MRIQLDAYLMPVNSPYAQNKGVVDANTFSSTYDRNVVSNPFIRSISADKIAAGTVIVGLNVGAGTAGYVLIDGANNRIIMNDGTTNRIVIGSV